MTPFTEEEALVWNKLAEAAKLFLKMEQTHPSHLKDFVDGIHMAQNQLGNRVLQREHPQLWATYKES